MSLYASSIKLTNQPADQSNVFLYGFVCMCLHVRNSTEIKERKENEMKTNRQLQQFTEEKWKKKYNISAMRNELLKSRKWGLNLTHKLYTLLTKSLCGFFFHFCSFFFCRFLSVSQFSGHMIISMAKRMNKRDRLINRRKIWNVAIFLVDEYFW